MKRNQRLHDAIRQSGRTVEDLAQAIETNPKTVERWVTTGRVPHPNSRERLASLLGVPAALLWPETPAAMHGATELIGVYKTRSELSPATIGSLVNDAHRRIDLLAYAALWLWDTVPGFANALARKAAHGLEVRICLGDPDSAAVCLRGDEEGIGEGLAYRCRTAATYAAAIDRTDGGAVRLSGANLYASIFRFDDDVLVNFHLWGNPASESPVFHFQLRDDDGIAANAIRSFERVWEFASPLSQAQARMTAPSVSTSIASVGSPDHAS
jgi:hypothetical protein